MGQVSHGGARTTEAVRRAIQHGQQSLRVLAKRCGINQKTVAKWKKRMAVRDLPTGPANVHSTVPSIEQEAIIVVFRKHKLSGWSFCFPIALEIRRADRQKMMEQLHLFMRRRGIHEGVFSKKGSFTDSVFSATGRASGTLISPS